MGGSLDLRYYSTSGAFNGSGIGLGGEFWNKETLKKLNLYFQHYNGDLRWMYLDSNDRWIGGSEPYSVASDAKNATPISVVGYILNASSSNASAIVGKSYCSRYLYKASDSSAVANTYVAPRFLHIAKRLCKRKGLQQCH